MDSGTNKLILEFESLSGIPLGHFCVHHREELCNLDFLNYFDGARHHLDDAHLSMGLDIMGAISSERALLIASEYLSYPTTFVRMAAIMWIRDREIKSETVLRRISDAILILLEFKNTVFVVGEQKDDGLFSPGAAFGLRDLYALLIKSYTAETERIINSILPSLANKLGNGIYNDFSNRL